MGRDHITFQRNRALRLTLPADEIIDIRRTPGGSYVILGLTKGTHVYLSRHLGPQPQLEEALGSLHPIRHMAYWPASLAFRGALILVCFTALLCVVSPALTDKRAVLASAAICASLLVWAYFRATRSINISPRAKERLWFVPVIAAVVVGFAMYKVMGEYLASLF